MSLENSSTRKPKSWDPTIRQKKETSNKTDYWGFLLGKRSSEDGTAKITVAVFRGRGQSYMRSLFKFTTKSPTSDLLIGDIVRFETVDPSEDFEVHTEVRLLTHGDELCKIIREDQGGIELTTYKIDDLCINQGDIRGGTYTNPEFGPILMLEDDRLLAINNQVLFFTLKIDWIDGRFHLQLFHSGTRRASRKAPTEAEKEDELFKRMADVVKIEKKFIEEVEAVNWNNIGFFRLVKFDYSLFEGPRPVLELIDKTKAYFLKGVSEYCGVKVIPAVKDDDGEYEVDMDVFTEGIFLTCPGEDENSCMINVSQGASEEFMMKYEINAIFELGYNPNEKIFEFWKNKEYEKDVDGVFAHSLSGVERPKKIMDEIDSLELSPEELAKVKDRNRNTVMLNEEQKIALAMALNDKRKVLCIQGPPGTGKTVLLSFVIAKTIVQGGQVVVLTPTKEACLNIQIAVEKAMIRLRTEADPNKVLLSANTYNQKLETHPKTIEGLEAVAQLREDLIKGLISLQEFEEKRDKIRHRVRTEVTNDIMKDVSAIFCTISSSFPQQVRQANFLPSLCVIDEASQIMEAETWPNVFQMKRIVLAGDPKQLPALVFSEEAKKNNLCNSVMDRIMARKDHHSWFMLRNQYRCDENIIGWASKSFYNDQLTTDESVKKRISLRSSLNWNRGGDTAIFDPLVLIDTSLETDLNKRSQYFEQLDCPGTGIIDVTESRASGLSFKNEGEAILVVKYLEELVRRLKPPFSNSYNIAVITPYNGQRDLVEQMLADALPKETSKRIRVGTIDSFQGQEFEVVVLSLVRSNPKLTFGFVSNMNRLNVAMTRAKKQVFIIANGFMMHKCSQSPMRELFDQISKNEHRFHPIVLFDKEYMAFPQPYTMTPINNFSKDFAEFYQGTRDKKMRDWIVNYVERGKDPQFREMQRRKKEQAWLAQSPHHNS